MLRPGLLAVAAIAISVLPCWAQFGGMGGVQGFGGSEVPAASYRVEVVTQEDQILNGTMMLGRIRLTTEQGVYGFKPGKIDEIRFVPGPVVRPDPGLRGMRGGFAASFGSSSEVTVIATTGEEITGELQQPVDSFTLETDLGWLTLFPGTLKSIKIQSRPEQETDEKSQESATDDDPEAEKALDDATDEPQAKERSARRVTYKTHQVSRFDLGKTLDALSADGWEIVHITPAQFYRHGDGSNPIDVQEYLVIMQRGGEGPK